MQFQCPRNMHSSELMHIGEVLTSASPIRINLPSLGFIAILQETIHIGALNSAEASFWASMKRVSCEKFKMAF